VPWAPSKSTVAAAAEQLVERQRHVGGERPEHLAAAVERLPGRGAPVALVRGRSRRGVAAEVGELDADAAKLRVEPLVGAARGVGSEQVGDPQADARRLELVGGADAARGGADLVVPGRPLARAVEQRQRRQQHLGAVGHEEPSVRVHPRGAQAVELAREGVGVDHQPVAQVARLVRVQDPDGIRCSEKCRSPNLTVWPALWPPW
jgi:hypothetical protein